MLVKIIPLLLLTGLTVKGATMAKDQMQYVMNYTKIMSTQHEITNLCTVINLELVNEGTLPGEDQWMDMVHAYFSAKNRDPTVDLWNHYYFYLPVDYDFSITSAGPDGMFNTQDDISSNSTSGPTADDSTDSLGIDQ